MFKGLKELFGARNERVDEVTQTATDIKNGDFKKVKKRDYFARHFCGYIGPLEDVAVKLGIDKDEQARQQFTAFVKDWVADKSEAAQEDLAKKTVLYYQEWYYYRRDIHIPTAEVVLGIAAENKTGIGFDLNDALAHYLKTADQNQNHADVVKLLVKQGADREQALKIMDKRFETQAAEDKKSIAGYQASIAFLEQKSAEDAARHKGLMAQLRSEKPAQTQPVSEAPKA